jgi:hypothetical protein
VPASRLHTAKILRLSEDLPIVVEVVDSLEKIEAFVPTVDHAIDEGLATLERVKVRFYRGGKPKDARRGCETRGRSPRPRVDATVQLSAR